MTQIKPAEMEYQSISVEAGGDDVTVALPFPDSGEPRPATPAGTARSGQPDVVNIAAAEQA